MGKKLLILLLTGLMGVSSPINIHASTIADQIQEKIDSQNEGEQSPDDSSVSDEYPSDESTSQTAAEELADNEPELPSVLGGLDLSTPDGINMAIRVMYDSKFVNDQDIIDVRNAYENLNLSDKVSVTNIDLLKEMEEAHKIGVTDTPTPEVTKTPINDRPITEATSINGKEYTFEISESHPSISIVLRYIEDADNDGRGDIPKITFICPTLETFNVGTTNEEFANEKMLASITSTENFIQFDIPKAAEGRWTITTTSEVMFERMSFQGTLDIILDESDESTEKPETLHPEPSASSAKFILILIGVIVFLLLIIIIMLLLPKPSGKKTSKNEEEDNEKMEARRYMTEEEEIQQLQVEYEKINRQMIQMDKEREEQIKAKEKEKEEENKNEEIYYVTQQDIDNDSSIIEYEDGFGTGLLSKENKGSINDKDYEEEYKKYKDYTDDDEDDDIDGRFD